MSVPTRPGSRPLAVLAGIGVALTLVALGAVAWLAADPDSDGASGFDELRMGTSPTRGDSDGDGRADGWEAEQGADPVRYDPNPLPQHEITCSIGFSDCSESAPLDSTSSSSPSSDDAVPSGGDGTARTTVFGVAVAVVAGVAGRYVGGRVLRS